MFVIAALLIALIPPRALACGAFCSAVLTQALPRGYVDYWHAPARAVHGGDRLNCCYALQTIFAARAAEVSTAYGTLTQLQPTCYA